MKRRFAFGVAVWVLGAALFIVAGSHLPEPYRLVLLGATALTYLGAVAFAQSA